MPRNKRRRNNNRRCPPRTVENLQDCVEDCGDGGQSHAEDVPNVISDEGDRATESENSLYTDEENATDRELCDDKEIPCDKQIDGAPSLVQGQSFNCYIVDSPKMSSPVTVCESHEAQVQIQELSSSASSLVNSFDNPPNISEPESSDVEDVAEDLPQDCLSSTEPKKPKGLTSLTCDQEEKIRDLISSFIECAPSNESTLAAEIVIQKRKPHFVAQHQHLNVRYLDSIREESSDTDAASDSTEKNSTRSEFQETQGEIEYHEDFNDEDDDVFTDDTKITNKTNAIYPKSLTLDLSKRRRHISMLPTPTSDVIREETSCILVDTKILEPEPIPGSSSKWETAQIDESQGAEIVFLESGSSSSASELDYSADGEIEDTLTEDVDIRIETPEISSYPEHPIEQPPSPDPLPNPDELSDRLEYSRQDSSGSVSSQTHSTSSHSQLTARYMASSMTDIEMDFDNVAGASEPSESPVGEQGEQGEQQQSMMTPKSLRQQCIDRLSSMPYGEMVLKELADVSQSISSLLQDQAVSRSTPPPPVPALPARELLKDLMDPLQETHFYSSDPQISRHTTPPSVPELPPCERPCSSQAPLQCDVIPPIACATKDDNRLLAIIRESCEHENQSHQLISANVDPQSSAIHSQKSDSTMFQDPREFDNMFEAMSKRFSNYELGRDTSGITSGKVAPHNKRYSNIETRSYESHCRLQDGKVLHEESKSSSEKITDNNGDVTKTFESESCSKPQKGSKVESKSVNREIDENSIGGYFNRDSGTTKIFGDDFLHHVTQREKVDDNFDFHMVPRRPNRLLHEKRHNVWESRGNLNVVDEWPENITRPLTREDNLCRGFKSMTDVKAPRLSEQDPNDLTEHFDSLQTKTAAQLQRRSMIDTSPITRHIGGNSSQQRRRLSLPKDFHDKQLQYIRHKEAELQAEFEKLELDRKRLEEEITTMQMSTIREESHEKKSNTLTEEEMFRQQMHSEWLDKVAEREERRLHKIIKITKPTDDSTHHQTKPLPIDIENEFLRKVKERRTKLSMPADSDWESGAESQPQPREPAKKVHNIDIKIVDGAKEANIKQLPKHLQEFAESFTIDITSQGESADTPSPFPSFSGPRFYVICAVVVFLGWAFCRPIINNK
ncbi:integral component of membrane [Sergentomyia squamirostris]